LPTLLTEDVVMIMTWIRVVGELMMMGNKIHILHVLFFLMSKNFCFIKVVVVGL
jgi:hypothetical protein